MQRQARLLAGERFPTDLEQALAVVRTDRLRYQAALQRCGWSMGVVERVGAVDQEVAQLAIEERQAGVGAALEEDLVGARGGVHP